VKVSLVGVDLLFKAKLRAVVTARGGTLVNDPADADLAVLAIEAPDALARIHALRVRGVPVLAFGSHVRADLLRAGRDAGATAVPNSEVEARLAALLVMFEAP